MDGFTLSFVALTSLPLGIIEAPLQALSEHQSNCSLMEGTLSGKGCDGKCPKLVNCITEPADPFDILYFSQGWFCWLTSPSWHKMIKCFTEHWTTSNEGWCQAATVMPQQMCQKPTDFITGRALERGVMLQHSLRSREEVANLEQDNTQRWSLLNRCVTKTCLLRIGTMP